MIPVYLGAVPSLMVKFTVGILVVNLSHVSSNSFLRRLGEIVPCGKLASTLVDSSGSRILVGLW